MRTVSDGVGVGEGAGCEAGVELGLVLDGCDEGVLLLESVTAGDGGAGGGDVCAVAAESGAAVAAESPALGLEPEQAEPNAIAAVNAAESRSIVIGFVQPRDA